MIIMLSLFILASCNNPYKISSKGIAIAKLGDEMPKAAQFDAAYTAKDTTIDAEGYRWPAVILQLAGDEIWIEGDFLEGKKINRVRIESDTFAFKKRICVGSKLADLAQISENWEATLLPNYGMIDVACKGVHFLINSTFTSEATSSVKPQSAVIMDPSLLDRDAVIEAIVVL